jgi:predicted ATP-dependent endonuclease of OLD family
MKHLLSVEVENFRSIRSSLSIPLSGKTTLAIGPNNSGKSNILRFLALLFNLQQGSHKSLRDIDFEDHNDQVIRSMLFLSPVVLKEIFPSARHLLNYVAEAEEKNQTLKLGLQMGSSEVRLDDRHNLLELLPQRYFQNQQFIEDFQRQSSDWTNNVQHLLGAMNIQSRFAGTIHVSNLRFISREGVEVPSFSRSAFPGKSVDFTSVVSDLRKLDRPIEGKAAAREQLKQVCDFIKYCIECGSIEIQVPYDSSTILVNIDGNEQPISNLGTGIEQLIIMGLAAFAFPEQLVLIDEPELHFHPRSQKRMMQYLHEKSPAKFVIATHSAALLDAVDASILRLENKDGHCAGSIVLSSQERFAAIRDLGHTPSELVQANFVVWVEGPSDRIYLNSWIKKMDAELREGVDYTFIFYGGRVLAQHDFSGEGSDLVNALSVARQFAVVMDSDLTGGGKTINDTKLRVKGQAEKLGGYVWVTLGREIENYIPNSFIVATARAGLSPSAGQYDKVIVEANKISKVDFAREIAGMDWQTDWPLDLRDRVSDLIEAIKRAG